jgi:hypothetical protein
VSFITTGFRELGLKVRRQKTRMAIRHERRHLQRSEINLGREGTSQAGNFPELRNEIVALKKLEQEQKEVALRIAQIEEGVRKIEADRQALAREHTELLARLEAEKKPILQKRNDLKSAADLCDRELAGVDKRIESNDAADRDLLKELSALNALDPPPADLEARSTTLGARRGRLPEERAELARARLGSAEACRLAKERLITAEADLATAEKNIENARAEFEAKDRSLNEQMRAQQEAIKEARAHHQTVEERKNPAYLNIGRHLATQGIAPPNAPELLVQVQRHRSAVNRHQEHSEALALVSSQIDKQELRKFYFVVFSVLVLVPMILYLFFQSPSQREWLPQETEAILSLNIDRFDREDLPKKWRKEQPEVWSKVWMGLVGQAGSVPMMNLPKDGARVTRAICMDSAGKPREFILIEARAEVTPKIRAIAQDKTFTRHEVGGLAVWQRNDLSVARIGPATLAVGNDREVDELAQVRLGIESDLKITGQLFDRFQALDKDSAIRLISRDPPSLDRAFSPIFAAELLNSGQLLGLALTLQNPVRARLLLKTSSIEAATQMAKALHDEPQRWLRLEGSDQILATGAPEVIRDGHNLEIRFNVPESAARLLLQRIARVDAGQVTTAQQ